MTPEKCILMPCASFFFPFINLISVKIPCGTSTTRGTLLAPFSKENRQKWDGLLILPLCFDQVLFTNFPGRYTATTTNILLWLSKTGSQLDTVNHRKSLCVKYPVSCHKNAPRKRKGRKPPHLWWTPGHTIFTTQEKKVTLSNQQNFKMKLESCRI